MITFSNKGYNIHISHYNIATTNDYIEFSIEMPIMDNNDLLYLIKSNDPDTFRNIYRSAYPSCQQLILRNSGTQDDAADLFQEALLILMRNARKTGFRLNSTVNAFLYGIVRNLWLKKLQKKKKNKIDLIIDEEIGTPLKNIASDIDFSAYLDDQPEMTVSKKVSEAIATLGEQCRELLLDFYGMETSLKELAEERKTTSDYLKLKKYRCMQRLRAQLLQKKEVQ